MNSAAPLPPVAVIGVDSPIGLALVRELGGHGVPVFALGKGAGAIGGKSRFVRCFDVIPGPLADWLPGYVARHGIGAVMAVSEHHLIELAALKGSLAPAKVLCPDAEKLALFDQARLREVVLNERADQVFELSFYLDSSDPAAQVGAEVCAASTA